MPHLRFLHVDQTLLRSLPLSLATAPALELLEGGDTPLTKNPDSQTMKVIEALKNRKVRLDSSLGKIEGK
jgi:hypothetical protein